MVNQVKYLYGASVQGIQSFIFQTNKLRDIVGASELVEEICTTKFAEEVYKSDKLSYQEAKTRLIDDEKAILFAAGNIKYIFETREQCEHLVLRFPKVISEFAPGITISQSVVKMKDNDFETAVKQLEQKLKYQRNKPMRSSTLGMMGIRRSRQTGLPAIHKKGEDYYDAATFAKLFEDPHAERSKTTKTLCKKAFGFDKIDTDQIALDIDKITEKNDWIAIIHADGNGLGQIVQKIGTDAKQFKQFSQKLNKATVNASIAAYNSVKEQFAKETIIPIRPIVLGGDDLTVIIRANLALDYTSKFLEEFEVQTKKELGEIIKQNNIFTVGEIKDRLTACAGIAYIKSSFPFYYGYELAEILCKRAKNDAKDKKSIKLGAELPQSCLMFHKVQDSFTENFDEISKRELRPQHNISYEFGPYYINEKENRWTVTKLKGLVGKMKDKEGNSIKSHLRNWLSLLFGNIEMASQKLDRLKSITDKKEYVDEITKGTERQDGDITTIAYPVYDILTIHTINTQETKEEKE